jgi:ketosteroid isomerase-like protein
MISKDNYPLPNLHRQRQSADLLVISLSRPTFGFTSDPYFAAIFESTKDFGMPPKQYAAYQAADPYFTLIRKALGNLVDGEHFFDIMTDNTIYEVLYDLGWPRIIRGRADLMAAFRGYVDSIALQSANKLVVHKTDDGRVVVLEYEVQGTILATRVKYNNRFCSIVTIESRKIAHWRDYMDSLAASKALTAKPR